MRICKQCQCQMNEGYMLEANTYGTIKIIHGTPKKGGIKAAICPSCGEISIYLADK